MVHSPFSRDRRRLLLGISAAVLAPACGSAEFSVRLSTSSNTGGTGPLEVVQPESVHMSSQGIADVFARIDARVKAGKFPGATAMICRHGKIVGEHAVGSQVRGAHEPVTMDTMFDMMSVTKVMATAISTMVLVDQGKVRLDDPVVKHLPKFTGKGKERVTIRHMLSYSAGLPLENNIFDGSPETIWDRMAATNLEYEPGTKVEYSDLTYRLLGKLVETVSGKTLDDFARENVWSPLGMTNTLFAPPAARHAHVAATGPTERRKQMVRGVVQDDQDHLLGGVVGCDGLFSTAKDAAVFCQMVLNGGIYAGKRILSAGLAAEMVKNQTPYVDVGQTDISPLMNLLATPKGYGWELSTPRHSNGGTRLSRNAYGKAGGTGTFMWVDPPRQIVAVILTNRGLPVPFDEPGWNKLLEDVGNAEFFNGVMAAVLA
jgi:serine-type D-Ala-D-Ala carboxypeptidase